MNQEMAKTETVNTNGVNVNALFETIEAVKNDHELAKFKFRARNHWLSGGHNQSTIQEFYGCKAEDTNRTLPFVFDADEPPLLLGQDAGANPVEFVLHALIACMTTIMVYHAAAHGIKIQAIDSELEGDLDLRGFLDLAKDVRKGYQEIRVKMHVKSQATADTLKELTKFSPVFDVVSNSVTVKVNIETY